MSLMLKWRAIAKAFTLESLSLEEKEALFAAQKAEDPSDTAKRYRYLCDALKADEEEFEKIYQEFRSKDCKHSVTLKAFMASGWNHPFH
jgi:hypothetical protein